MGMPRPPRIDLPGVPCHVYTRGNNRGDCFFEDHDRVLYLRYLDEAARANRCAIHAYVLMTNHVHLVVTPAVSGGLSRMMQSVDRRYAKFINASRGRTGTLYEGRFRANPIQTEPYFLACMRYVEMNPVRARLVEAPADYRWSSHRENASGAPGTILTPHEEYLGLGPDAPSRGAAYRALFEEDLDAGVVTAIREHAAQGKVLGLPEFQRKIEAELGRPAGLVSRGRPARSAGKAARNPIPENQPDTIS